PSSVHFHGSRARREFQLATETLAAFIGAEAGQIFLTSGGTEANNWALWGSVRQGEPNHVIVSSVEHHSVLEPARALADRGVEVTFARADSEGRVDPEEIAAAIGPSTRLVSVMLVNNQVGTIQPIARIARAARDKGVPVHCDAVQAGPVLPIDVERLGVDMLSLSAHKIGGPTGCGLLYVRTGTPLQPLIRGGHQQSKKRAGTVPVALAAGFAEAARLTAEGLLRSARRMRQLRDRLEQGLRGVPEVVVNTPSAGSAPHILNVSVSGLLGELVVAGLDQCGISVSAGSACTAGQTGPSHVLSAMGADEARALGAVRFSLGHETTEEEIDACVAAFADVVQQVKRMGG
ncbi:MAG: cysteine desulfurase, partial [Deltaproteobacteria bacterium]